MRPRLAVTTCEVDDALPQAYADVSASFLEALGRQGADGELFGAAYAYFTPLCAPAWQQEAATSC